MLSHRVGIVDHGRLLALDSPQALVRQLTGQNVLEFTIAQHNGEPLRRRGAHRGATHRGRRAAWDCRRPHGVPAPARKGTAPHLRKYATPCNTRMARPLRTSSASFRAEPSDTAGYHIVLPRRVSEPRSNHGQTSRSTVSDGPPACDPTTETHPTTASKSPRRLRLLADRWVSQCRPVRPPRSSPGHSCPPQLAPVLPAPVRE